MADKSSVEQIRARFDVEVDRFSHLETGQTATVDAPLILELIAQGAAAVTPHARDLLDVGCGAGNYTLKLLGVLPRGLNVTMLDLSRPMLDRAAQRVGPVANGTVRTVQADIRELDLPTGGFDVITAAAVLHHLRGDDEWHAVFRKFYQALRPGGSLWISDLVAHDSDAVQTLMWKRYGDYLTSLEGPAYRDAVFAYIEAEDTPRSLSFQTEALRQAGFPTVEIIHKNACMAALGAIK